MGSNARHGVPLLDDVGEVDSGEEVVGGVEASARERNHKGSASIERGWVGYSVVLLDLVRRDEAAVEEGGNGGECIGMADGVARGDGSADSSGAGAGADGGDAEEETGGEDAVLDVGKGDVDGIYG